jgi:cytochrome c oxidase subunit 2
MSVRKIATVAWAFLVGLVLAPGAWAEDLPKIGLPVPWGLGLLPGASPVKTQIDSFHNLLLVVITVITVFVLLLLLYVMVRFNAKANPTPSQTTHNTLLEVIWTAIPVIILVVIAIPSFKILYLEERSPEAGLTIKVIGHQWYWSVEYPDSQNLTFDTRMIPASDLKPGDLRLLEVDNRMVVPVDTNIRFLVTATDVIHSFAMPVLGVKKDAVPGRMNETWAKIERPGIYYGQCSELCGTDHGFMPMAIEAVSKERFQEWLGEAKQKFASDTTAAPATQVAATPAQ